MPISYCRLPTFRPISLGIDNLANDNLQFEKGCFDLSGRKIDESKISNGSLKPGLYIINQRKVVIK